MRIPSKGQFVLFQFTGDGAGRIMFRPGPTKAARAHFLECVKDLECLVVARLYIGQAQFIDTTGMGKMRPVECVRYRGQKEITTWENVSDLIELCRSFGDWIAGNGQEEGQLNSKHGVKK
jgi:hypothetical protein